MDYGSHDPRSLEDLSYDLALILRRMRVLNDKDAPTRSRNLSMATSEGENAEFRLEAACQEVGKDLANKRDGDVPEGAMPGYGIVEVAIAFLIIVVALILVLRNF